MLCCDVHVTTEARSKRWAACCPSCQIPGMTTAVTAVVHTHHSCTGCHPVISYVQQYIHVEHLRGCLFCFFFSCQPKEECFETPRRVRRQRATAGCKPTGRASGYGRGHVSVGVVMRRQGVQRGAPVCIAAVYR